MRRAIILGNNPYRTDYQFRNYKDVFEDVGQNTGNQAITYGVARQMAASATFLPWGAPAEMIRASGDVLVFPMANFLGGHTDLGNLADRLIDINLPIVGLGLGAQSQAVGVDVKLTPGTQKWLEVVVGSSPSVGPNLGLRGLFTEEQLRKLGFPNAGLVTGCPSNFINPRHDFVSQVVAGFQKRPKRIAVAAGIPFLPALQSIERELADIVTITDGAYIVQHGINMVQLARRDFAGMKEGALETCHSYIMPNKSLSEFTAWCERFAYAIFDVPAWMDFLRRFDFVVGTRFHGAMLALQAGVPAGCIAHDSRTVEMCETMGIPYRQYTDINCALTQHNVIDLFSFDHEKYLGRRSALHASLLRLYQDADLEIDQTFRAM